MEPSHSRTLSRPAVTADRTGRVEVLAIGADEAATMLPPAPVGQPQAELCPLYTLVSQTANQAGWALEKCEDMIAQLSAYETTRAAPKI